MKTHRSYDQGMISREQTSFHSSREITGIKTLVGRMNILRGVCFRVSTLLPSLPHFAILYSCADFSPCSPSWVQGSLNAQLILQSVMTTPQSFSRTTMPLTNSLFTRPRCQHGGNWQLLGSKCRRRSSWHSYPGDYNGTKVDLLPFFSSGLASELPR